MQKKKITYLATYAEYQINLDYSNKAKLTLFAQDQKLFEDLSYVKKAIIFDDVILNLNLFEQWHASALEMLISKTILQKVMWMS